jgi:GNAT superfamily N-acetyltransferase
MRRSDLPAAVALCRAAHWNQTEAEWRLFLEHAPDRTVAAERDGRTIGTALLWPYGADVAWVSMVLVDPAERGRGVGRSLLDHAIGLAGEGLALRLDATPAGRQLYSTMGFRDDFGLARYRCTTLPRVDRQSAVQPLRPSDWGEILQIDPSVFGADRRITLEFCWRNAPDLAWIVRSPAGIDGYALGRHGHDTDHVGPIVATRAETAVALAAASLSRISGRPASIDVPDAQTAFTTWIREHGFVLERPFTRMTRGPLHDAGRQSDVFAAAGPEFG